MYVNYRPNHLARGAKDLADGAGHTPPGQLLLLVAVRVAVHSGFATDLLTDVENEAGCTT